MTKKIKVLEQNIVLTDKDIIVHQVNCLGKMGSGVAKAIYTKYPEVKKEYLKFHKKEMKKASETRDLLGLVQFVDVYDGKIVANVFGQDKIRKNWKDTTVYTKEDKLIEGIQKVKELAEKQGFSVAIPYEIGCGLANGDWNSVQPKIEAVFEDSDVDVVFYFYKG